VNPAPPEHRWRLMLAHLKGYPPPPPPAIPGRHYSPLMQTQLGEDEDEDDEQP
jgi:hypothetical protein